MFVHPMFYPVLQRSFGLRSRPDEYGVPFVAHKDDEVLAQTVDDSKGKLFTSAVRGVPCFVPYQTAAPLCDPKDWGRFVNIKTHDPVEQESWDTGWRGTIQETITSEFFKELGKLLNIEMGEFDNVLNIDPFEYNSKRAITRYSLNECLIGDLSVDEGYTKAEPSYLFDYTYFSVRKTIAFAPDSPWAKPELHGITQAMLDFTVFAWTTQYALNLMLYVWNDHPGAGHKSLMKFGIQYLENLRKNVQPGHFIYPEENEESSNG